MPIRIAESTSGLTGNDARLTDWEAWHRQKNVNAEADHVQKIRKNYANEMKNH